MSPATTIDGVRAALGRRTVRQPDGARNVRVLLLVGVSTVLVTRALLAASGYPQVGNGTLHVAHALWGGLLMLVGLMLGLLVTGGPARVGTALVGGVGVGLFVDEVGKFVTQHNDYFFRPAAGIMYCLFAVMLLAVSRASAARWPRGGGPVAEAALIAAGGLAGGLTARQRRTAERLVSGRDDEAAAAVRRLLAATPERTAPERLRRLVRRPLAAVRWLVGTRWLMPGLIGLFTVSRVLVAAIFLGQALSVAAGHHLDPGQDTTAVLASAVVRPLEATLAVTGAVLWRRRRRTALTLLSASLYLNLFVTQLFNFTDSQFGALAELPYQLVMLAMVAHHRRLAEAVSPPG
ncbi:hypothetical protein [Actinocatenispora rupis]|uniref:Uncharacterized protein n=1 Tax=Actinocatenispora rupis TaxID=519421 RepID=A0A8J3NCP4_9ACTN|nr:hypothetical protein [Actinocatenispora rupis]GID12110.1 hypothetical protein Aru02nite_29990 [Actinocatenispora rupis]